MLTFTQIKERLGAMDKTGLESVSGGCGVPFHTLLKIWNGQVKNPRIGTVEKLSDYFEANLTGNAAVYSVDSSDSP